MIVTICESVILMPANGVCAADGSSCLGSNRLEPQPSATAASMAVPSPTVASETNSRS